MGMGMGMGMGMELERRRGAGKAFIHDGVGTRKLDGGEKVGTEKGKRARGIKCRDRGEASRNNHYTKLESRIDIDIQRGYSKTSLSFQRMANRTCTSQSQAVMMFVRATSQRKGCMRKRH